MIHRLNPTEAVRDLSGLVIPCLRDTVKIGNAIGGNQRTTGVSMLYMNRHITLTVDQYELFRVQVLQYIQEKLIYGLTSIDLDSIIESRIREVFANE
jgi:hypothetical protein